MQVPIAEQGFSIFPLRLYCGDKFVFKFNKNVFACAANINGIIYRTANTTLSYPHKIILDPGEGRTIINYSGPIVECNIIDGLNYISVTPEETNYTLTWVI
jgi:hypothetical protein